MDEEFNFRRNKMDSMISSYQNKGRLNRYPIRTEALVYKEDDLLTDEHKLTVKIKETKPENLKIRTSKVYDGGSMSPMSSKVNVTDKFLTMEENNIKRPTQRISLTSQSLNSISDEIDLKNLSPINKKDAPSQQIPPEYFNDERQDTPEKPKVQEDADIPQEKQVDSDLAEAVIVPKKKVKKRVKKKKTENKQCSDVEEAHFNDINPNDFNVKELEDIGDFVFAPVMKSEISFKCQIKRDASGLDRSIYPVYILYHENSNGKKLFLLAARTRKKTTRSNYIISLDPVSINKNDNSYIGKIKSNMMSTKFTFVGNEGTELSSIFYEYNPLGVLGPRKIKVSIPKQLKWKSKHDVQEMEHYQNKSPEWSPEYRSYLLNFNGRVTEPSIKNFQLINPDDPERIIVQFGKIGADRYSLDFLHPFTPVQAFSIALTSFASKIARE